MNKIVSIIVPVYNVQDYISRCLDSLKNQRYKEIEIIIVDDGSTDQSGVICDEFVKDEKRAKVFHKKNGGLSSARNFGLKKSKGDLVVFVDSDDYVKKDYVSEMVKNIYKSGSDVVTCSYNNEKLDDMVLSGKEATIEWLIGQRNVDIVVWNKMYKRELFINNKIEFPLGKKNEDVLTTYKLLSRARQVSYLSLSLYYYTERPDSIMSMSKIEDRLAMREEAAREAGEYLAFDKDLVMVANVSLLLAKYAYIDAAIAKKIGKKYYVENMEWIKKNKNKYFRNKFLTKKLRLYLWLVGILNGRGYLLFRKIIN